MILSPSMEVICTFQNMLYLYHYFFLFKCLKQGQSKNNFFIFLFRIVSYSCCFLKLLLGIGIKKQTLLFLLLLLIWLWLFHCPNLSAFKHRQTYQKVNLLVIALVKNTWSEQLKKCALWFQYWNTGWIQSRSVRSSTKVLNAETNP